MKNFHHLLFVASVALAPLGCDGSISDSNDNPDDPSDPDDPAACEQGLAYTGIGGAALAAGRIEDLAGADRLRLKPYSSLAGEYRRVLGNDAADVAAFQATFGAPPARWYEEADANASSMYATYTVAFQGCLALTGADANYATAPTEATAAAACDGWARRFWDRTPGAEELAPCTSLALEGTAAEANPSRRWAYVCAAVLSSSGFVTF